MKVNFSATGYKSKYYAAAQQMQADIERNHSYVLRVKKLLKKDRIAVADGISLEYKRIVHIKRYNDQNIEIDATYYVQKGLLEIKDKIIVLPNFEKASVEDCEVLKDALNEAGFEYNESKGNIINMIPVKVGDICEVIHLQDHFMGIVKVIEGANITISILDGNNLLDVSFSSKDSIIKKISVEEKLMFKDWLSMFGLDYKVIKKLYMAQQTIK